MDYEESREWARIAFVLSRDGESAVQSFAEQGIGQYESAIREADSGGNGYGAAYRESLLASIRVYRRYLEEKGSPGESQGTP